MHYYYCSDDQFRASTTLKQPTYLMKKNNQRTWKLQSPMQTLLLAVPCA
jgi:hypothetical protein